MDDIAYVDHIIETHFAYVDVIEAECFVINENSGASEELDDPFITENPSGTP